MLKEFRDFIARGNVMDMAVGIIIGVAFGKVITSLVNDVIMPPVGMLLGGVDFSQLQVVLKPERVDALTKAVLEPGVAIRYGPFINSVIDFGIIAFCIFMVVKVMNRIIAQRKA